MRAFALVRRAADLGAVKAGAALGETCALAVLPDRPDSVELLAQARTAGAKRLVRLWDEALESTDYLGVAITLAATLKTLAGDFAAEPTAILCGDHGHAAVGPALAERLSLPHLGGVVSAAFVENRLQVKRRAGGVVRLYSGAPPAILCVEMLGSPETPDSTARGDIETWTFERIGLRAAELAWRKRFRTQAQGTGAPPAAPRRFDDARALVARLKGDGLLPRGGA